jgi:hypothetical protein
MTDIPAKTRIDGLFLNALKLALSFIAERT